MKATDNIVLSIFIGLSAVGLYSNYLLIFAAIKGVLNIVFRAVKASMGNLFVSDDVEKKYFFFEVMNLVTVILYGSAAVSIAVVSNEFIECWIGPEYVLPQPLPILIGVELLFTGLKLNLAQIRHVSGVFRQMWFRPVIGSVINVCSSVLLVQFWGISGVICGTLLAAIFANLIIDPVVIHKYSFENFRSVWYYYRKNIIFILILVMTAGIIFFLCGIVLSGQGIVYLVLHTVICLIGVILSYSLFFYHQEEYAYLRAKGVSLFMSMTQRYFHHSKS